MEAMNRAILSYLQRQAWALDEHVLDSIYHVICTKSFGQGVDIKAVEEAMGRELKNTYQVQAKGSVMVLPVHGIVGKRMNLISYYSGGVSTDLLKRDIAAALNNPEVDALVLDVDSPGGTISGVLELADFIHANRGQKPIIAHANELMASAAYWIGSAADKVYASKTANVGSIGVYMRHYDFSKYLEKEGIKPTYIFAGKYKTIGNQDEELKGRERNIFQDEVDALYTMFVDSVVKNRGISRGKVEEDALALLAQPALDRGLIDGIMTFEEAVQKAGEMATEKKDAEKKQNKFFSTATKLSEEADALIAKYSS